MTSPSAASEGSRAASGRDGKAWLASCSAFAVALLLLGAMLWTLFEKNLVNTLTQQEWTRELYAISAALTKIRFGIAGSAVDRQIFTTLQAAGIARDPPPELNVQFPDNLRDAKLLQSALQRAQHHRFAAASACRRQWRLCRPHGVCRRRHRSRYLSLPGVPAFWGECRGADVPLLRHRDGIVGALQYWSLAQRRRHGRRRRGDARAYMWLSAPIS